MEESSSVMFLSNCSRLNQAVTVVVFISFKVATEGALHFTVKDSRQIRLRWQRGNEVEKQAAYFILHTHLYWQAITAFSHQHRPLYLWISKTLITVFVIFLAICHLNQITTLEFKIQVTHLLQELEITQQVEKTGNWLFHRGCCWQTHCA